MPLGKGQVELLKALRCSLTIGVCCIMMISVWVLREGFDFQLFNATSLDKGFHEATILKMFMNIIIEEKFRKLDKATPNIKPSAAKSE